MADEEALLKAYAEGFGHGPGDADDTDIATAFAGGDNVRFDVNRFLAGLDAIFDRHAAADEAGPYLEQAMADAENAGDDAGLLTVLNETMGFYRSQGRHEENQWIVQRAIELALRMGLEGTEAWATTLINCATAMRAAECYDQSEDLYRQALKCSERVLGPKDRRIAALHNNLSMLYSQTGRLEQARHELELALGVLESASVNPDEDLDVASTHTNLALVLLQEAGGAANAADTAADFLAQADAHATRALDIYATGHLEHSAHFASALAGLAQVRFAEKRYADAVELYRRSLTVIEECYGRDTDYWRITKANLDEAEQRAGEAGTTHQIGDNEQPTSMCVETDATSAVSLGHSGNSADVHEDTGHEAVAKAAPEETAASRGTAITPLPSGMALARAFWEQVVRPMIAERYPEYAPRIAAGLVGHGSECYGFDDAISQDHDFGPRCCLWLTDEDHAAIGERLQSDYEALPRSFTVDESRTIAFDDKMASTPSANSNKTCGTGNDNSANDEAPDVASDADCGSVGTRRADVDTNPMMARTPRAQGAGRREGVFSIGGFFESITGYRQAPPADRPHEWLMLDEATLAAATNGAVFADPLGDFSATRQGFKAMPDDVRLSLISRRLGMIAQAGQYNLPRMLERGDGAAAWLSIREFVDATASLVFLFNGPITVGYLPYYKWSFAALRRLSSRIATRMADVCEQLENVMRLASAACYGGEGFGEGGKGSGPAIERIESAIEQICAQIVVELKREGLTRSDETFLEWQRPYVEEHIQSDNPVLRSL